MVGGSTHRSLRLFTKIGNFHILLIVQKEIFRFEITVHDHMSVTVLDTFFILFYFFFKRHTHTHTKDQEKNCKKNIYIFYFFVTNVDVLYVIEERKGKKFERISLKDPEKKNLLNPEQPTKLYIQMLMDFLSQHKKSH